MNKKKNSKKKTETQTPSAPAIGTLSTIQPEAVQVAQIPSAIGHFDGLGLTLNDGITLQDWKAIGVGFARVHAASGWALGDWLNAGARFEKDGAQKKAYKEAILATGIDYGRLRTFASISARFPLAERRAALSFEHHRLLAPVKNAAKVVELMDRVENERLSAAALRDIVPKTGKTKKKKETPEEKKVRESKADEVKRKEAQDLITYLGDMPTHCMHLWRTLANELIEAAQPLMARFEEHEANKAAEEAAE